MTKTLVLLSFLLVAACGSKSPAPTGPGNTAGDGTGTGEPAAAHALGGCSGTLCVEPGEDAITTCEFRPEYACYRSAECARQSDGACGWTQTPELAACLANPPPQPE